MAATQGFVKPSPMPGDHVYEGVTFPSITLPSSLDAMKTWQARPDDVFLITYPKSGTHWILEIVHLIFNGADPSKIDRSKLVVAPEMTVTESPDMESIKAAPPGYKIVESWKSPRIMPSYLPEQFFPPDAWEKKVKMIYLARNPKDVFCSASSFMTPILPPELADFDNYIRFNLLSDEVILSPWFDHVLGYWKHRDKDNFLFVKYEELQKDLLGEVKRIAKFLDRPLTDEVAEKVALLSTMKEMKKTYAKHEEEDPEGKSHTEVWGKKLLNKGKVGRWKEKITGDLNALFDKVYQERMAGSGLEFDFEI